MIAIERFFENHLKAKDISAEELRQFCEDTHARIKTRGEDATEPFATNYTVLAGTIDAAFQPYDSALGARAAALATQESGTLTKDDALRLVHTTIRQRRLRVADKLVEGSAGYEAFFPRGLTQYTAATLGQMPALLDQIIAAAGKYRVALGGDELLTEFTALKKTFMEARGAQVDGKGGTADSRFGVRSARTALELVLGAAILELAKLHIGHPERARDFFNQSLLEDPNRSQADDLTAPSPS